MITMPPSNNVRDPLVTQRAEFDAMAHLAAEWRRLNMTPIVDDDYPEIRHAYESELAVFIEAMCNNDRFEVGSRLRLLLQHAGVIR